VSRPSIRGYLDKRGVWRELRDPDKPATGRQLAWLNRRGQLDVVPHPHQFEAITMGEAAAAIDDAVARGYDDDEAAS
jgi:hypothetical protein